MGGSADRHDPQIFTTYNPSNYCLRDVKGHDFFLVTMLNSFYPISSLNASQRCHSLIPTDCLIPQAAFFESAKLFPNGTSGDMGKALVKCFLTANFRTPSNLFWFQYRSIIVAHSRITTESTATSGSAVTSFSQDSR